MSDWQDKSDFEINKAVTVALGVEVTEGEFLKYQEANKPRVPAKQDCPVHIWVDYCNNPSDSWPIIIENKISVEYDQSCDVWIAHQGDYLMGKYVSACKYRYQHEDKNPLRAAMIVYLEMNGVKPNE